MSQETTSADLDPHRLAEVIVTYADGTRRRGSGYRITSARVLTAGHVIAGAASIEVRFDAGQPDEWTTPASLEWHEPPADLALLTLPPGKVHSGETPVRFGRLRDGHAIVRVHAVGFPRWKRRHQPDGSTFREAHQADGTVAVLSNRRDGTLEFTTTPPAEDPAPGVSPWEAMSGAAVWARGRIIGIVAEHHRPEGPGRLTAVRIDHILDQLAPPQRQRLSVMLGISDPSTLVDVVPVLTGSLAAAGYQEQVGDIVPAGGLRDRAIELDELAAFCAGDETYVWWQADPWAGKSALMSTFTLNPPAGVDVVSFFVTGRLASQSDSDAFTESLISQLHALLGEVRRLAWLRRPTIRIGEHFCAGWRPNARRRANGWCSWWTAWTRTPEHCREAAERASPPYYPRSPTGCG